MLAGLVRSAFALGAMKFVTDSNTTEIVLRPATPDDAAGVTKCVRAAYAKWVPGLGRKPWPMLQDYSVAISAEIVFVGGAGDQVVGVLVLSNNTDDGFLIENVAVLPALAGRGIGKLQLVHAEQEAKARGFDSIYLYTNEKMTENLALYARIGYVEYERRQEQGFCRVFMRKALS